MNGNGYGGHNLDCTSALALMLYDPKCARCGQIKKVIFLRRKTIAAGCPESEVEAAQTISDALVTKYGLTRGEIYDRAYAPPPTKIEHEANVVWAVRKKKTHRDDYSDIEEIG